MSSLVQIGLSVIELQANIHTHNFIFIAKKNCDPFNEKYSVTILIKILTHRYVTIYYYVGLPHVISINIAQVLSLFKIFSKNVCIHHALQ
jgi:hypothetical protein